MENKNTFLNSLTNINNEKLTENGAPALKSTKNALIDLFATIGAMRNREDSEICNKFALAYAEDRLLAMKMLFYARDVREGLGERRIFRVIAKWLATHNHTEDMKVNFDLIAEYGRWDDFYAFVGTPLEASAFACLNAKFNADLLACSCNEPASLLAKWLASTNTSSKETRKLGNLTAKYFYPEITDINRRNARYRKDLSKLRKYLDVVETKMSAQRWEEIKYENVPSRAGMIYRDAFIEHDEERYNLFMDAVKSGEKKINTAALFPYDLVRAYHNTYGTNDTLEEQWKALPNFVTRDKDFLIMADVSGSMSGTPMDVSISLAAYFGEKNKGAYHNKFMTFSERPTFVEIPENMSLREKIDFIESADWGGSTNLEAAFNMVLKAAVEGNVPKKDMPEAFVVITDMEINDWGMHTKPTFTKEMGKRFSDAGYEMPTLVWWNVNARQDTFHAEWNDSNVRFISGCSATVFKSLCENLGNTPEELMLLTLNSERYDAVKIAE